MALRHGLLGLLAEGPASGYDLAGRFQEVLGAVWPAQHPKIYGELGKLADEGLIAVASEGPRGRKAYEVTDAGLAEVRRWLAEEPVDHTLRLETLFRAAFLWLLPPEQQVERLRAEAEHYAQLAALYRDYADRKERGEFGDAPHNHSLRVVAEAGARLNDTLATWARWALTVPPADGSDAPGAVR